MFSFPDVLRSEEVVVPTTVLQGVSMAQLWTTVFSGSSNFLKDYHEKRHDTNVVVPKWECSQDRCAGLRMMKCITIVDVPREGTLTPLNEAQRFMLYRDRGQAALHLVLQFSSQAPEVMMASTFRAETLIDIVEDATGNVSMTFYGGLRKMSWSFSVIRGMATPRALKEMKESYKLFMSEVADAMPQGKAIVTEMPQVVAKKISVSTIALIAAAAVGLLVLLAVVSWAAFGSQRAPQLEDDREPFANNEDEYFLSTVGRGRGVDDAKLLLLALGVQPAGTTGGAMDPQSAPQATDAREMRVLRLKIMALDASVNMLQWVCLVNVLVTLVLVGIVVYRSVRS